MTLQDRFHKAEAAISPYDRQHLRWRLHPAMVDAIAAEFGFASPSHTGLRLLGYPVDVDASVARDAIEYDTGGRLIPRGIDWPPCISCGAPLDTPHAADCAIMAEPDTLDAAWAAAEAALPEGWVLQGIYPEREEWKVLASSWTARAGNKQDWQAAAGPTPAAALRALAAKLGEAIG